jgi:putative addiction module killer protein
VVALREYLDHKGESPFAKWLRHLNAPAAAKVTSALVRIERGNFSNVKGVGAGVYECRIDFGPGYRVYFGKDGENARHPAQRWDEKRQERDIQTAHESSKDYKQRKARGE